MKNLIPLLRAAPGACAMGIALFVTTTPAWAQTAPQSTQEGDWNVVAGLGVLRTPIFPGASKSQIRPAPYLSIDYGDRFFVRGPVVGVNLFRFGQNDRFRLGVMTRITPEAEWDESDDRALHGLGKISGGIDAGVFGSYRTESWFAELAATRGAVLRKEHGESSTRGSGTAVQLGFGYTMRLASHLRWMTQVSTQWADATRTRTYFGVSQAQSLATELQPYRPSAGITSYGVTTTLNYAFGKRWTLTGLVKYERLTGDAKSSPIVTANGRTNQVSTGVFLGYQF
ncbi:outer membrane scaffolding protein for murein synthesis (MipA/OmpV family) [Luteibacter jiangsuensis]|uniref:Outer membrane scaffolding protein for murein synthesis (MipA/OmpV family) n=1 Tax=Luteibacter jiangsuensis TaxID=637577 RepID=A0ABT9T2Q9_9GAMM|nr:MipA/OmpV family protein [Luteibacter jiangsuensis]MDQ0011549.1 outer membrane scaffolding protein for murein synthesis (MipA/OmpV family) [Luteibacter jiangsuensis]